jgi:predicted methyltransferase
MALPVTEHLSISTISENVEEPNQFRVDYIDKVIYGDCLDILNKLPENSVDLIVIPALCR